MNLEPFKEFAELTRQKKEIEGELKPIKARIGELSETLVSIMIEEQVPKMEVDGFTLSMRTETYVGITNEVDNATRQLSDLLIEHGFDSIVKPGTRDLKSLVKSFSDEGEEVPEWLSPLLKTSTETKLSARKAK